MSSLPGWRLEAVGIEPWPLARIVGRYVVNRGRGPAPDYVNTDTTEDCAGVVLPDGAVFQFDNQNDEYGHGRIGLEDIIAPVIDLDDPDVLAMFDRRLALRLGLESDLVALGVCVMLGRGSGVLTVCVGAFAKDHDGYVLCQRSVTVSIGDTLDLLLARVRAWNSVS